MNGNRAFSRRSCFRFAMCGVPALQARSAFQFPILMEKTWRKGQPWIYSDSSVNTGSKHRVQRFPAQKQQDPGLNNSGTDFFDSLTATPTRSEERRVGKECRSR